MYKVVVEGNNLPIYYSDEEFKEKYGEYISDIFLGGAYYKHIIRINKIKHSIERV